MAAATTETNAVNLTSVLTDAEESINNGVKEVERTFLFTDVPCGAMKFKPEDFKNNSSQTTDDVGAGFLSFCGGIERAFCFTDLEDIDESDIERLKTKSIMEENQKEEAPAVEPADTESMSDDSAGPKEGRGDAAATPAVTTAVKATQQTTTRSTGSEPIVGSITVPPATANKIGDVKVQQSEASLPPANALQASTNNTKDGKPMNALQAARASKTKNGKKKKGWGLFRRSSRKAASA